jgi:hypothetical protein
MNGQSVKPRSEGSAMVWKGGCEMGGFGGFGKDKDNESNAFFLFLILLLLIVSMFSFH